MRLGFFLPQFGTLATQDGVREVAMAAEAIGYDSLWVSERLLVPLHPRPPFPGTSDGSLPSWYRTILDPLDTLTFVAAFTNHVRLGTSILNLPWYDPVLLARRLTTLDVLSGGRLAVGFGIGWSMDEYQAAGASWGDRGPRTDEALEVLKAIWTNDPVQYEGSFYTVPPSFIGPKPVQDPHPPIYLGMYSPAGLERTARYANGWNPDSLPFDKVREDFSWLLGRVQELGRDEGSFELIIRAAVDLVDAPLPEDRSPFAGSSEQFAEDLAAVRQLGAAEVQFEIPYDVGDGGLEEYLGRMEAVRRLAGE